MSKRLIKPIIILLAGMFCSAQAIEIRPLAQIQFPAKTNVAWEIHGSPIFHSSCEGKLGIALE